MTAWRMAMRDVGAHAWRYALMFAAIALGVMFLGGTLTLTDMLRASAEQAYEDAYGGIDVVVRGRAPEATGEAFGGIAPLVDQRIVDEVASLDGVDAAEGLVSGDAWLLDRSGRRVDPSGDVGWSVGLNWMTVDALNPFDLTAGGRPPAGPGEVVVDKRTADRAGYRTGDRARVRTGTDVLDVTITGLARIAGADGPGPVSIVLFAPGHAVGALGTPGRVTAVWVVADEGVSPAELASRVEAGLARAAPGPPGTGTSPSAPPGTGPDAAGTVEATGTGPQAVPRFAVVTGDVYSDDLMQASLDDLDYYARPVLTFALAAVVVSGLVISTSLAFVVAQRRHRTALLRALGAGRRQVVTALACEALVVGVAASAAGYVAGVASALGLLRALWAGELGIRPELVVLPRSVLLGVGTGVVVTAVSAIGPAWRTASLPPVAVMREAAGAPARSDRWRTVAGVALLAAAAWLAGSGRGGAGTGVARAAPALALAVAGIVAISPLAVRVGARLAARPLTAARGPVGRHAQQNALRSPRRSALTASAVAIGLVIVTYMLVLDAAERGWAIGQARSEAEDPDVMADLYLTAPDGGVPATLVERVAGLPEVRAVSGRRSEVVSYDGTNGVLLMGVDPGAAAYLWSIDTEEGDLGDLGDDGVALSGRQADDLGLGLGDRVTLTFPRTGTVALPVRALYRVDADVESSTDARYDTIYAPMAVLDAYAPGADAGDVPVALADGVPVERGRAALAAAAAGHPQVEALTRDERAASRMRDASGGSSDAVQAAVDALLALTFVVAMVGVVNTQVLSTVERSREIGLLRALGAGRGQVRSAIRWETLLVGVVGIVLAVAVGLPVSLVLIEAQQPWLPTEVPVRRLAGTAGLVLAVTFAASTVPAWWSTRRSSPLAGTGRLE